MVSLKNSFSRRYSNLKFEKFEAAQAITARSLNILEGKERPAKAKLFPAKLRADQHCAESDSTEFWIFGKFNRQLRAVLANFGFSEIFEISPYGS